jgi:hypothetical protein
MYGSSFYSFSVWYNFCNANFFRNRLQTSVGRPWPADHSLRNIGLHNKHVKGSGQRLHGRRKYRCEDMHNIKIELIVVGGVWTLCNQLSIGSSVGIAWTRQWTSGFQESQEIYWPAVRLSGSLQGLCAMDMISFFVFTQLILRPWTIRNSRHIKPRKPLK